MKRRSPKETRKILVRQIRDVWASLDTHLDWVIEKNPKEKDSRMFHVKTSLDYATQIIRLIRALF